jgi:hypothetical protein
MKEISKGNKEVIDKQVKEIEKKEREVNHEYESNGINGAIKSVIKTTFKNETEPIES